MVEERPGSLSGLVVESEYLGFHVYALADRLVTPERFAFSDVQGAHRLPVLPATPSLKPWHSSSTVV